jgi:GT2 family glycosyltransferase
MPTSPALSAVVVIATYRRPEYVRECLAHLAKQTHEPARIVVVDASHDRATRDIVTEHPHVEYRRNDLGPGSTATSRAIGILGATEDVIAFIDDDAFAEPEWLENLLLPYADPAIDAVGGRARNGQPGEETDGLGSIGIFLPNGRLTGFFAADPGRPIEVDHLIGANMSLRATALRQIGGIRDFYPGTCLREESDIALRMRHAGKRVVYAPSAVVRHVGGEYAKGRRFDTRYRYYGARNHVVLLSSTLGLGAPPARRYIASVIPFAAREAIEGLRSAKVRGRSPLQRVRAVGGGFWRAATDIVGSTAGLIASIRPRDRAARYTRSWIDSFV